MAQGSDVVQEAGQRVWGVSLKRSIIAMVVTYAAITALMIGNGFRAKSDVISQNFSFLIHLGATPSNRIGNEHESISLSKFSETGAKEKLEDSKLASKLPPYQQEEGVVVEDKETLAFVSQLYHSPSIFTLNYDEMVSKFKIYIYPSRDDQANYTFRDLPERIGAEDLHGTEDYFYYNLFDSSFVTMDPEVADLFFLPISIRTLWEDPKIGPRRIGRFLANYVATVRADHPYWSRTLGADHVLVVCHDYKEDGSRNGLELKKNTLQVACSPLAGDGNQSFFPHKDIAMPVFSDLSSSLIQADLSRMNERKTLAYYVGPTSSSLYLTWRDDPDFVVDVPSVKPADYLNRLASSKYCLNLRPQDTVKIVDALRFGCVPVIISDGQFYDLPFQDALDWKQFAVIFSMKNVHNLKKILSKIPSSQYKKLQSLGVEANKHLEWHISPQPRDAFHMVLYDLWLRRHTIRYARRSISL